MEKYELYRELHRITEWSNDGAVKETETIRTDWFDKDVVHSNIPGETNLIYAMPSDEYSQTHTCIRKVKS